MVKEVVILDGKEYLVNIIYSNINGIRVRVNLFSEITVKSNKRYDIKYIKSYLQSIESWLEKNIKLIEKNNVSFSFKECFNDEKILLFGDLLDIVVDPLEESFRIDNKKIFINNNLLVNKAYLSIIRNKYKSKIRDYYHQIFNKIYPNDVIPKLEFKYYSARWGSFHSRYNKITLNERLIHLPLDLIKIIIIHEIIHTKVFNHGDSFYRELLKFVPDYKEKRKKLKTYSFVLTKGY